MEVRVEVFKKIIFQRIWIFLQWHFLLNYQKGVFCFNFIKINVNLFRKSALINELKKFNNKAETNSNEIDEIYL